MYQRFWKNITDFVFVEHKAQKADIIFVPGNGYPQMAEKAAQLWREGYSPRILPSGRYSICDGAFLGVLDKADRYAGEYGTEWEFLQDVLLKNGVAREAILKEDQAVHTYDNAVCSRKVTDRLHLQIRSAMICCKNYHARRCLMYYQLLYPDTDLFVVPCVTDGITAKNWYRSSKGRELVMGEMERFGWQFHKIAEEIAKKEEEP
ncbi:MAG: YdcF family protein [Lachnospiraceae bacterium]|jgi:uncharacterized SAM-binding protein YcdF (DUF218 family)